MPVIPAPTTSTSTAMAQKCTDRLVYGSDVAIVDRQWPTRAVPFAVDTPDRVRKERYFDPDFYALEAEQLWPRVWQMACRLEEIPNPNDFVSYEFLDQSVIVVRGADMSVTAMHNVC